MLYDLTNIVHQFNHGVKDARYKVLSSARTSRAAIFAGLPNFNHAIFSEKPLHHALAKDPTITYWRGTVPEDLLPPIIFPPGQHMDMDLLYRSEPLARVRDHGNDIVLRS